jgi:phosphopantothenoylcysteine decarboxylase/phosphopantothenate--cysteine ligase
MRDAVIAHAAGDRQADALSMAAAVADFRPAEFSDHKIKKSETGAPTIELATNPDILVDLSLHAKGPRVTVGFAAESDDLVANAQAKLERKKLDLIVANDITAPDAGFEVDTNRVLFVTAEGVDELPLMSKAAVGMHVVAWVAERLA